MLITGLPRSGTTLTCELLDRLPDTVALDEPMDREQFLQDAVHVSRRGALRRAPTTSMVDLDKVADNIVAFMQSSRRSLLNDGTAWSKHVGGRVRGAKVSDARGGDGLRQKLAERGRIAVDKELSPAFLLAAKHNSGFMAVLEQLTRRLPVFAVVRNPLATLASWSTVPFPVHDGHASLAEAIDHSLTERLAALPDRVDRQLSLMDWFFERIDRCLPARSIIRYEDLIATNGTVLRAVTPRAGALDQSLSSRNVHASGAGTSVPVLAERLLASSGAYWRLYGREEVEGLLTSLRVPDTSPTHVT